MGTEYVLIEDVLEVLEQSCRFEFYVFGQSTLVDRLTADHLANIGIRLLYVAEMWGSELAAGLRVEKPADLINAFNQLPPIKVGDLVVQRCRCGRPALPMVGRCEECLTDDVSMEQLSDEEAPGH